MNGSTDPDKGFDRLLRGEIPETPTEQVLGSFLSDVRAAFPSQPLLAEEVHLAGVVETAQLLADKGEPVVRPASKAVGRGRHASGLPKRRRVAVKVPVLRSLAAKLVAGLVVLMSMFGGIAFAGALPGGLQSAVSGAAAAIGVDLPDGEDEDAVEPADPVEEESEAPETTEVETEDPETEDPETEAEAEDSETEDPETEAKAEDPEVET